jgi:hypothetical protein
MDIQEIIKKKFNGRKLDAWDVMCLIINVKKYQTPEWIEYFKSLNPSAWNVSCLIANVEKYQTPKWIEYFKSLKPDAWNVNDLISNVPSLEKYFK